ncbi:hypothetical protein NESM_000025100 [Novymonas esmeraldas]|uniref:Uncharacterized protein n=1 Tax=Novymonas esmeraldas TaxID=1808958 RepID=A0AAW0F0Q6_9TRYP
MRGNPYSRGFDPLKPRSERRREKQAKLAKTKRVIRLKKRLGRIAARKFAGQEDSHMTALMESYILRRKAERAAEKAKEDPQAAAATGSSGDVGSSGDNSDAEESGSGTEVDADDSASEAFSLGSGADSAFELGGDDDDGDSDGTEEEEEEDDGDTAAARRRGAQQRQKGAVRGGSRGRGGPVRGGSRGRGGRGGASWAAKKDATPADGKHRRGGGAGGRGGQRGRGGSRGGGSASHGNASSHARFHERSRKVPTRSLY